jgi:integrase
MIELYKEFLAKSDNGQVRPDTLRIYKNRFKRCMEACGKTVSKLDAVKIRKALLPENPTPSNQRTYASIIRCARSIFNKDALKFYKSKGFNLSDPFVDVAFKNPKAPQYSPLPKNVIESIWNDCEQDLAGQDAIIVLLALGMGMRQSEIRAARMSWLSVQAELVSVSIQHEEDYTPKSDEKRVLPMSLDLYNKIVKLREESSSEYIVPRRNATDGKLKKRMAKVAKWLRDKGVNDTNPIHNLRKAAGSIIAKNEGIIQASRFLGHSNISITAAVYVGVELNTPVAVIETLSDPIEIFAKSQGVSLEALKEFLAKQKNGL